MTDTTNVTDRDNLAAERLREILDYAPDTGIWTWRGNGRQPNGAVAGTGHPGGYRQILINGFWYLAHRLAWLYMTGEWPPADLDHVNRNRSDNRWINLRVATRSLNCANRPQQTNNTSGLKGVTWSTFHRKWQAQIQIDGKKRHLGYLDTPTKAWLAYVLVARKHFGDYARIEAGGVTFFRNPTDDD